MSADSTPTTPRGAPKKPSRALVRRVAERIFGPRRAAEVLGVLDRYGTSQHERERSRVQIAILKLCEERGETDPTDFVAAAKEDYRDILQAAEYPRLSAHPPHLDERRRAVLRRADRADYLDWLALTDERAKQASRGMDA